jgi:NAD(P) transhydrogenase subunit alpha
MESILTFLTENKDAIFIIVLSIFLGFEVISNVPSVLHTPLMSGANAISGVIIIGGIILVGHASSTFEWILGAIALFMAQYINAGTSCSGIQLSSFSHYVRHRSETGE